MRTNHHVRKCFRWFVLLIALGVGLTAPWRQASAQSADKPQAAPQVPAPSGRIPTSVREGVFTPAQAADGEKLFREVCAACHKIGDFEGQKFSGAWVGSTVGALLQALSMTMPQGNPGSMKEEEYAAVVAFLLRQNGYPAGQEPLASDASLLADLKIESK